MLSETHMSFWCYPITATSCHIQILDVSLDGNSFVSGLPFSPPLPHLKFALPCNLRSRSLGLGSALGEKGKKKLAWAKNGGERLTLSPSPGHRYIFVTLPRFLPFLPTAESVRRA